MAGGWVTDVDEQKTVVKKQRYCQLCLENGCHIFSLFQAVNHISTALYVYELMYPPTNCDWQTFYVWAQHIVGLDSLMFLICK